MYVIGTVGVWRVRVVERGELRCECISKSLEGRKEGEEKDEIFSFREKREGDFSIPSTVVEGNSPVSWTFHICFCMLQSP